MPVVNLYSKRNKKTERKGCIHGKISEKVKTQILIIFKDFFYKNFFYKNPFELKHNFEILYSKIHHILKKEYGKFDIDQEYEKDENQIKNFLLNKKTSIDKCIDVIELLLYFICFYDRETDDDEIEKARKEAIDEINERFRENGIGYSYTNGQIIRVDSTYIHNEITKPTLNLLSNKKFSGANDEYLKAHKYYKNREYKECIMNCCRAFESTMKIICEEKKWKYDKDRDTAKQLINILLNNKFTPIYYQKQLSSLTNLLISGIPTIRNKTSGHGQGDTIKTVDDHIARFALNLTGANIIFLIEQSEIK